MHTLLWLVLVDPYKPVSVFAVVSVIRVSYRIFCCGWGRGSTVRILGGPIPNGS